MVRQKLYKEPPGDTALRESPKYLGRTAQHEAARAAAKSSPGEWTLLSTKYVTKYYAQDFAHKIAVVSGSPGSLWHGFEAVRTEYQGEWRVAIRFTKRRAA